jgi:hypothetical protein
MARAGDLPPVGEPALAANQPARDLRSANVDPKDDRRFSDSRRGVLTVGGAARERSSYQRLIDVDPLVY